MKHYTLEEILEMYPEGGRAAEDSRRAAEDSRRATDELCERRCARRLAIVYDPATEKESLLKDLKGKAGVYLWFNIESGDYYIGSSVNLCNRFRL